MLEQVPFALRDSVNDVAAMLAPKAHAKGLEFSVRLTPDTPDDLIADPVRIKQVLVNLVGNAIKFTDQGTVSVEISPVKTQFDEATIKMAVVDTGIGIQPQQQESLFAAFGQADTSITRRYGGTGLGLIISQKLAREMGGDITLASEVDQGSTFEFTFVAQRHSTPIAPALPIQPLANRTLLYFEPEPLSRLAASEMLASWGLDVTQLGDTATLPAMAKAGKRYDLALFSPKVNIKQINELKRLVNTLHTLTDSIFLLVNITGPQQQQQLAELGVKACLSKPFNHRKLASALSMTQVAAPKALPNQPGSKPTTPLQVLAVDDNEANLKLITTLLKELVDKVEVAKNGSEALAICTLKSFDLIFMDIQMPVMDGITACTEIKKASLNQSTPIIAVTAHALPGEKEKLMESGFNGYLTKPIDDAMLIECIENYKPGQALLLPTQTQPAPVQTPAPQPAVAQPEPETPQVAQPEPQAPQAAVEVPGLPKTPRIDHGLALERANGKADLAVEMLNMLLDSLPAARDAIDAAVEAEDAPDILRHVHKLHGACCYTGVPRLKDLAWTIETEVKKTDSADGVMPELYELIDEIDNLLKDCEA